MIIGYFVAGSPYPLVRGHVTLDRLGVSGWVEFVVDTGAVNTSIHPRVRETIRIPYDALEFAVSIEGVSGSTPMYLEAATLTFNELAGLVIHRYEIEVIIGKPEDVG